MGKLAFDRCVGGHFTFGGFMGDRVEANLHNWLLTAPDANPGMIEMFRLRDREPVPSLVPWAGEFVGKYLISAIQARRMTQSKPLEELVQRVIADLISTQAEDGYLGPLRKDGRLLGPWGRLEMQEPWSCSSPPSRTGIGACARLLSGR